MNRFRAATTRRLGAAEAAAELAAQAENGLGGAASIGGGFLLATAASGDQGQAVGQLLGERWPEVALLGTSFEGVLGEGQVWRDEPALALFVWEEGAEPPLPFVFGDDELEPARIAEELLSSVGRSALGPEDLVLLFPDATGGQGWPTFLKDLEAALGEPQLGGAAASGLSGGQALGWSGEEACPGALLGILIPGPSEAETGTGADAATGLRVAAAGATRAASPWLEITGCRTRWVDELDEEPPLDWIRRQLGLGSGARIEPYLDRLMARVRRRAATAEVLDPGEGGSGERGEEGDYEEQFLIGLDARRGAISLPGTFERGDELAFALPDADLARDALRGAVEKLRPSGLILQFSCRARDEQLHGDRDVESAIVAHQAGARTALGTLAPFQVGPGPEGGAVRQLVHATVLAAVGDEDGAPAA